MLGVPVTIASAAIMHRVVELPLVNAGKSLVSRHRARRVVDGSSAAPVDGNSIESGR